MQHTILTISTLALALAATTNAQAAGELGAQTTKVAWGGCVVANLAQVDAAGAVCTGAAALDVAVKGAAIHTVATGSGATIMSTMAGVSTVPGVAILAGTGLSTAAVLNNTVYSDCQNQHACDNAQVATYAGAAVGTAGATAAVIAAGAGPAGLAAIGSTLGGGMALGAASVLAAPVVGAVAIGALIYWASSGD